MACLQSRDRRRRREDARLRRGVVDEGIRGEVLGGDPGLEAVHPPPDEAFVRGGHADGVVGTPIDVCHCAVFACGNARDDGWVVNVALVTAFADLLADAGFAVGVEAPGVDNAGGGDGERVVGAAADGGDGFAFQAELGGGQSVEFHAFDDAAAELVLLAGAPGVDGARGG